MRERPTDNRPCDPVGVVVEVDQDLADDRAVGERDDPVVAVQTGVDDEARRESLVQRTPSRAAPPTPSRAVRR